MKVKYLSCLLLAAGLSLGLQGCLSDPPEEDKQLKAEVLLIDDYLKATNAQGVYYDNTNGIRFQILQPGYGVMPKTSQSIDAEYFGSILNPGGTLSPFDNDIIEDQLSDVKPEGLKFMYSIMQEGARARIFLPSKYAFGEAGTSGVPANSTIVYDVELNEVVRSTAEQNQFVADTTKIGEYVREDDPTAVKDQSGIYYKITAVGSDLSPTPYDVVTFNYKLKLLTNDGPSANPIQSSTLTQSLLGLIDGFRIILPKIKEGGKVTFYVPSYLGYGASRDQSGQIPANSILIFEIELTDVVKPQ
ncbi:FKBP-type peptidyl-prolyl cis-trans isomerase [Pseudochryseolinea flava]|uniref:Peptidyl-prolyl cis-trans isomerase n=1 Tax=Pseudochryseolinea flava TaxID=2059302 RepID=A0A364Y732_9BACT|nr:FKBP-type peptidyl-prolyl cis-trans isomerase [Pseudochryseolinea flava]RAW02787.1 hypothetical protein DQQ10_01380 [Pseudochryseolinea flava]